MSKELGRKLKLLRSGMGFTQSQIAVQISVDRSTYSNYERAITEPEIKTLIMLAHIFGVDVDYLLSDEVKNTKVADSASTPIYSLKKDEQDFLIRLRLLNNKEKESVMGFINGILENKG